MTLKSRAANALITAGMTTAATTTAALVISKLETGSAAAGLNATSHIVWGDEAARVDGFEAKYTLVGGLLNAGAMLAWAVLHEAMPRQQTTVGALTKGLGLSISSRKSSERASHSTNPVQSASVPSTGYARSATMNPTIKRRRRLLGLSQRFTRSSMALSRGGGALAAKR